MLSRKSLRLRLRALVRRNVVENELDEEIRFHLEREIEKNRRLGMNPVEARRVAMAATAVESADTLATFGEVFQLLSNTERAGHYVARALKIDPKCARAYVTRAQLGTAERSLSDLGDAIFIDPNLSEAYRVRAEPNDSRVFGGVENTLADLSRAIELEPEHAATLRKRAILFGQTKEWKKAIGDWARLVDLGGGGVLRGSHLAFLSVATR